MEVILLEKIRNLGGIGDKVNVKPGHVRNFLLPKGKVVPVTEKNLAEFEAMRADLEKKAVAELSAIQQRADALTTLASVTVAAKASDEGKLYGSVGVREIADAITTAGCTIEKREINLPEGPIHETGEFDVSLQLHGDVKVNIKVIVVAEQ